MAFKALLYLGDGEIPSYTEISPSTIKIIEMDYGFTQAINNSTFTPTEKPKGGIIKLVVESTKDEELIEWMIDAEMVKNGNIVVIGRQGEGAMRSILFKGAFCVQFHEKYQAHGKNPMLTLLTISCQELKVNNTVFNKDWNKS